MKKSLPVSLLAVSILGSACSSGSGSAQTQAGSSAPLAPQAPSVPSVTVKVPAQVSPGCATSVELDNGGKILICKYGETMLHRVEGTFSDEAFAQISREIDALPLMERGVRMRREIDRVLEQVASVGGVAQSVYPEAGYFTFMLPVKTELMSPLKGLKFNGRILFNPVLHDPNALAEVRAHTPGSEGLQARSDGRASTTGFSGLERIHAPQFVQQAEQDIGGGARVDGSSVRLGITDTGITYNHPTFLNREGTKSRVIYMRDFTAEGRVYFNPSSGFKASTQLDGKPVADDEVAITAEIIDTPKLPNLPAADKFNVVKDAKLKVSPELKAILLNPSSGARLGFINEDALQGAVDVVDLNANGKLDDHIPLILVPGTTPEQSAVYVGTTDGDFRDAKPLHDFNASGDLMPMFAEKLGFDVKGVKLVASDGKTEVDVLSASIVGFDPGNHGSHVAGIAAGRKTIANDSDDTLARGVAPGANILLDRVCANNGGCNATEAMIDLAVNGHAEVINMSLGGLSPFNDGYGVQETVVNRLTSVKNVLFVISAGNSGPGRQTVGSPSTARLSLSVGASASRTMIERQYEWPGAGASTAGGSSADDDFMLFFSSRGPTAAGGFKPNVSAPGTELSSVQLNTAPGSRGGLDVYWGTSMAAPTTTGAYALFLDAIKKYNAAHPDKPMTTDAAQLRNVIISSARAFDVSRFDAQTGERSLGQYTWIDEGMGMIDLTAAWKKLQELRDSQVPTAVSLDGKAVELDYEVITSITGPNGLAYDGTQVSAAKTPAFGTGLFLDASGTETLREVHVARRLPLALQGIKAAGDLTRQLRTTADTFVLRTTIYGSDKAWLKAGVVNGMDCAGSPVSDLTVLSEGVLIETDEKGAGKLNPIQGSQLNVCIDRDLIAQGLPQGDHGALIAAYRTAGGKVSPVPSFIVPVFLTVPHKTLLGSTAYESSAEVTSFGVSRNYVKVPKGTTVVRLTLEVPAAKTSPDGRLAPGESCSGVEAMLLEGSNSSKSFKTRAEARIMNCDATGAPVTDPAKRKLVLTRTDPTPGVWDIHVFGSYKYRLSKYRLRVDYITAESSKKAIRGDLAALKGTTDFTVREASVMVAPDQAKSSLELTGLSAKSKAKIKQDENLKALSPTGEIYRTYPTDAKSVTITTGGSPGNDVDLAVLECVKGSDGKVVMDDCSTVGQSGGPTDEESVTFKPQAGKVYVAMVAGYDVKMNDGVFTCGETIELPSEKGTVAISGASPVFHVGYEFSSAQLASSRLAKDALFTSGKYSLAGALTLRSADETVLGSIPVEISVAGDKPATN